MKLVIATPLYPPEPGGPATYARMLEERLPAYGIAVTVVKFSACKKLPRLLRHLAYLRAVSRAMRGADLVLVQDTVSCGVPAALACLLHNVPLVVRVPGDYAWEQARERWGVTSDIDAFQRQRAPWQAELLRAAQRWVTRRARSVIVPSRYFAGIVTGWGVPASKVSVIYHGVTLPAPITKPDTRPAGRLIVSAGRLVPWKGFETLIRCLGRLPGWSLAIVGDGPERSALERAARSLDVQGRVIFTGALARPLALGWCAAADAFVLNTSFESFSFQVLEAMALGVPVITTTAGSLPELMRSGVEGVLLEPDDTAGLEQAIASVAENRELWKARTDSARRRAAEFSEEKMLAATAAHLLQRV